VPHLSSSSHSSSSHRGCNVLRPSQSSGSFVMRQHVAQEVLAHLPDISTFLLGLSCVQLEGVLRVGTGRV
jgi:hypothetical protein